MAQQARQAETKFVPNEAGREVAPLDCPGVVWTSRSWRGPPHWRKARRQTRQGEMLLLLRRSLSKQGCYTMNLDVMCECSSSSTDRCLATKRPVVILMFPGRRPSSGSRASPLHFVSCLREYSLRCPSRPSTGRVYLSAHPQLHEGTSSSRFWMHR